MIPDKYRGVPHTPVSIIHLLEPPWDPTQRDRQRIWVTQSLTRTLGWNPTTRAKGNLLSLLGMKSYSVKWPIVQGMSPVKDFTCTWKWYLPIRCTSLIIETWGWKKNHSNLTSSRVQNTESQDPTTLAWMKSWARNSMNGIQNDHVPSKDRSEQSNEDRTMLPHMNEWFNRAGASAREPNRNLGTKRPVSS